MAASVLWHAMLNHPVTLARLDRDPGQVAVWGHSESWPEAGG